MTELAKTTIYIRNIQSKTTNEQLSEFFSTVGPVKSAFGIVPKSGDPEQQTKCGFVHFAMGEDAVNALTELKKKRLNGNLLKLELAKHRNRKPVGSAKEDDEEFDLEANPFEPAPQPEDVKPQPAQKPLINVQKVKQFKDISRTVLISGLDQKLVDRKQLFKKVKKFGDVADIQYPYAVQSTPELTQDSLKKQQALVRFKSVLDAKKAVSKLDDHIYKGDKVKACIHPNIAEAKRSNRLVIRNLKFATTIHDAWNALSVYGPIVEITLPPNVENENKKNMGFGFVTFAQKSDADAAMTAVNGNIIKDFGRLVILDYVKPKDEYENSKEKAAPSADEISEAESEVESEDMEMNESEFDGEINNDEESDDEIDADMDEGSESEPSPTLNMNDADDGRTLFIRNLSFNTTNEDLKDKFEEYGKVDYARVVMDRVTGMPKGTGFVKMSLAADADKILSLQYIDDGLDVNSNLIPESSSMITLDSRPLHVLRAVTKSTLNDSDETKSSKVTIHPANDKDKRNIYLLREILYNADSPVYSTLSQSFLDSLKELHSSRVKKLRKQMHMCVSRTRLSVRHLGKTITEDQIKKKCFDAVKQFQQNLKQETAANRQSGRHQMEFAAWKAEGLFRSIKIKHVKVMNDKVTEKSMGYGFIEFDNHAHAMACMRIIKNSEQAQGANGRRWVLEFAIENSIILKQRLERLEKSKLPQSWENKGELADKKSDSGDSKYSKHSKSGEYKTGGFKKSGMRAGNKKAGGFSRTSDATDKRQSRSGGSKRDNFNKKTTPRNGNAKSEGFNKKSFPSDMSRNADAKRDVVNKKAVRDGKSDLKQGKRKTIKQ